METKEKLKFVDENIGVLEISESSIVFTPPLYRQRYQKVKEKIESYSQGTFSKVLDLGCSDLKFFRYLRDISGVKEIVVVDKDEATLKDNIHHLKPMLGDFIMLRTEPLTVKAVCGDATVYNPVMKDAQVVTMIELIEHMYPSELPHLIDNVFKRLRPKLVIITTPNADFNQYIPDFVPGTFRHWDHKFEWSGEEFRNWCHGIVQDTSYYSVQISGCGLGPHNTYCTQMAIFIRSTSDIEESLALALGSVALDSKGNIGHDPLVKCQYDILVPREKSQIISEVSYPVDSRTAEEKDRHFILHRFHSLISYLQTGEDNQNYCLDWREAGVDEKNKNGECDSGTDHCDWSPIPINGELHNSKKGIGPIVFRCLHVNKEEEIKKSSGTNEFTFPIIRQRCAVIDMASLSAWINSEAEGEIPFNLIRSTVEPECYDCRGEGETWQGKTLLWHDSSDEEKREVDDSSDDHYKGLSEYDGNHWACDTWEGVNSVSPPVKQAEEDWEWGESDTSHGSAWGS
ncbi:small RNA 2'-O-methyltransferase isoform X1 [Macrobrachium rosenbergii]|uniref:small RNA 2'-O-methyltransferase isoform X1 n=2 Tax=Macrobrachium rosenbergii TaxID=79674 RepID=UPI0034D3DE76